jgi:sec-independent protein translocase protein TatB
VFEVGFWELVVILTLVLVVAGPQRLPEIVRTLGRWTGRAKALAGDLKREFERELDAEELRQLKRDAEASVRVPGDGPGEPPR